MSDRKASASGVYRELALAYDAASGERSFDTLQPVLEDVVAADRSVIRTHLDLACGTGLALQFFSARGYYSVGFDASVPMLHIAKRRHRLVVAADLRAMPFSTAYFSIITCLNDSIRVLRTLAALRRLFVRVAAVMRDDSIFVFDVRDAKAVTRAAKRGRYRSSAENYDLDIRTRFNEKSRTEAYTFRGRLRDANGDHVIRETIYHRVLTRAEILSALASAGLVLHSTIRFNRFADPRTEQSSLMIIRRKAIATRATEIERQRN